MGWRIHAPTSLYGYFVVMPVIFLICIVLYWRFRRDGWL
jgi:Mg2+ and Co2+ transporter CorA